MRHWHVNYYRISIRPAVHIIMQHRSIRCHFRLQNSTHRVSVCETLDAIVIKLTDRSTDYAFEMVCSTIRFGPGVTREIGDDLRSLNTKRTLVITDSNVSKTIAFRTVIDSMKSKGLNFDIFDRVHVEPTDASKCMLVYIVLSFRIIYRYSIGYRFCSIGSIRFICCRRWWIGNRYDKGGRIIQQQYRCGLFRFRYATIRKRSRTDETNAAIDCRSNNGRYRKRNYR